MSYFRALISRPMSIVDALLIFSILSLVSLVTRVVIQTVLVTRWKKAQTPNELPVSVLIAARNMADSLKLLVPELMGQTYKNFEVIVALDRCHDESLDLMKSFETQYKNLKTVIIDELPDHFSPKKYALTLGVKACKNEWILVTDADCHPKTSNWIKEMASAMDDEADFVLGYAPYYQRPGFLNAFIHFETFNTALNYLSSALMGLPYMGVGRNMAFRKSLFLNVRGYNKFQHIMGGDDDLFVQHHAKGNRTKVVIGPDSQTYSEPKQSLQPYWKQKKRHFSVSKFYKSGIKWSHSMVVFITICLWVLSITTAIVAPNYWWISTIVPGYYVFKGVMHHLVVKKMGEGYPLIGLPLFEAIYITFVPAAVLLSSLSKKVKWN
jgi:cellulose synthase/poly-beta-1,6-N-acetylglucosamine synthase-like glycosyltransferase